jgi:hypothetical protein
MNAYIELVSHILLVGVSMIFNVMAALKDAVRDPFDDPVLRKTTVLNARCGLLVAPLSFGELNFMQAYAFFSRLGRQLARRLSSVRRPYCWWWHSEHRTSNTIDCDTLCDESGSD